MNEAELRQALIVQELENLKADIECDKKMFFYDEGMQKAYANSIEIINSHIAKIKGENKWH